MNKVFDLVLHQVLVDRELLSVKDEIMEFLLEHNLKEILFWKKPFPLAAAEEISTIVN
jgi:hypothetical protein